MGAVGRDRVKQASSLAPSLREEGKPKASSQRVLRSRCGWDGGRWAYGLSLAAPRYPSPPVPYRRGWDGMQWEQLSLAQVQAEVSDPPATWDSRH